MKLQMGMMVPGSPIRGWCISQSKNLARPCPHNQIEKLRRDVRVTADDLLKLPAGTITEEGLRTKASQRNLQRFFVSSRRLGTLPDFLQGRLKTLSKTLVKFGVPILPLHTADPVATQIRETLGYIPGKQPVAGKVKIRGSR